MHRLQMLCALFLLAQVIVGYAGWFAPRHEIFPFPTWILFVIVPNQVSDYDLLLRGTTAQPQEPPRTFNRSTGFVYAPHSITSYHLIQQFGEAVEAGDTALIESLRPQIEEQFALAHMRYDLINVTYEPVARWKTGQILSSRTVRAFVATELPLRNPDQQQQQFPEQE